MNDQPAPVGAKTSPLHQDVTRLDLGCGTRKQQGFFGVDAMGFAGVDLVHDLRQPWPFADGSIEEIKCSHFLEHLTGYERIGFFNELYRVMKRGARATIITPHWSHERAYGDPTHAWPPVCRWTYSYLDKAWRDANAPHVAYSCDFEYVLAGKLDQDDWVLSKDDETKKVMMIRNINICAELIATLTKK